MYRFLSLFLFFLFVGATVSAADDFVSEDEDNDITGTSSPAFIIDSADAGGDLQLQFGDALAEHLKWISVDGLFELSDSLRVGGNLEITETEFELDSDNAGAGVDVRIIANQGSDNAGELRYNSTTDRWEVSNDGGTFKSVLAGSSLSPYIGSVSGTRFQPNTSRTIRINGGNFDPSTAVTIVGWPGTIDDVRYISHEEMEVDATSGTTETTYSIVLENGALDSTVYETDNGLDALIVETLPDWVDLRLGGDVLTHGNGAGNDIRYGAGMSLSRDANGMFFTGLAPWSSWVKVESLAWVRGDGITLEWIFSRPTAAMMIGIGSTATNETNTAQYQQAEVEAYFNSGTNFWGLYGNNGTVGSAGNQSAGQSIAGGTGIYKIKFEEDGGVGETFTLYELPSAAQGDWDDESNILSTVTIGGTLNPDETDIMPFFIPPNGGTQRFIAVRTQ